MAVILFFVVVGLPFLIAVAATGGPKKLRLLWETTSFVPPGPETAASYRGHVPGDVVVGLDSGDVSVEDLPAAVRVTAGLCRIAFCIAMVSVLPVVVVMMFDPRLGLGLGVTGLALAAGQLAARSGLLSGAAHGASRAFGVGVWTIVHQLAILGVVVHASSDASMGSSEEGLRTFAITNAGVLTLAYAAASGVLGIALLVASRRLVAWRSQRNAV